MNHLALVLNGIRGNIARAIVTVLCVATGFALFGILEGVRDTFHAAINDLDKSSNRLFVSSRISRMDPLSIAQADAIRKTPGVQAVSPVAYLLAFYREPTNWVGGYAIDIQQELSVFGFKVPTNAAKQMALTKTGAIVGRALAQKYNWKVGDKVPLISEVWQRNDGAQMWAFDVLGIYDSDDPKDAEGFLINYDYFDQERVAGKGTVAGFWVRITRALEAQGIGTRIDDRFMNSSDETVTQSGKELTFSKMRELGNVDLIVRALVSATLVLLFFVVVNTLRQSAEERLPEFAVLKSLGFSGEYVAVLVIADALLLVAIAACVGLVIACLLLTKVPQEYGKFSMTRTTLLAALSAVLALAFGSAALPAYRAWGLSVVDALRKA